MSFYIKKIPERKEPSKMPFSPMLPWRYTDYESGWNDCLDAVIKAIREEKQGN